MKFLENRSVFVVLRTVAHVVPLFFLLSLSYFDFHDEAGFIVKLLNTSALLLAVFFFGQHTRVVFSPEAIPSVQATLLFIPFLLTMYFVSPNIFELAAISFLMAALSFWEHVSRGRKRLGLAIFLHSRVYLIISLALYLLGLIPILSLALFLTISLFLLGTILLLAKQGMPWRASRLSVKDNVFVWITSVANLLNSNLDVLVASYLLQPVQSVQYFLISRIIRAPEPFITALVAHLNVEFSTSMTDVKILHVFRRHQVRVFRILLAYAAIVAIAYVVTRQFFPLDFSLVAIIFCAFCFLQLVSGYGFLLVRLGKFFQNLVISCLAAVAGLGFVAAVIFTGLEQSVNLLALTILLTALVKLAFVLVLLKRL